MALKGELKEMALHLGADLFGVATADALAAAPPPHRPSDIMADAKSIVVLGMKLLDAQVDLLDSGREQDSYHRRTQEDVFVGHNALVSGEMDKIGYKLARFLERQGFRAYHQPYSGGGTDRRYILGFFSLKHAAQQAGLAAFGRSSLIITPEYGPRVRLTGIVTNAALEPDQPYEGDFCADCPQMCIETCPVSALQSPAGEHPYEIDKFRCQQYLSTKTTCSICLQACPIGNERVR